MANVIKRGVWWNRRKVGDLGGVTGVNQSLKRLVLYWDEEGVQNIYIMSESSGTYSKPTYPLITLPGSETYEVDFFQTEDFLFVNARNSTDARLYICMDDYAQLVRIPDVPHINSNDITELQNTHTFEEILAGNYEGIKKDADKYFMFRFAWRLKNGAFVGHSQPILTEISKSATVDYVSKSNFAITSIYNGQTLTGTNQTPDGDDALTPILTTGDIVLLTEQTTESQNGYYRVGASYAQTVKIEGEDVVCSNFKFTPDSEWFFGPSEIDRKIFDGVSLFMTQPKKIEADVVNDGVFYEVERWTLDEVVDKASKVFKQTEEKVVSNPVLTADIFSSHRFGGNTATNFNEVGALGGVYTDFALPEENRNLLGLDVSGGKATNVYDEITIEVEGQTYTRWGQGTYYEDTNSDLVIPGYLSYPDKRATRWRIWKFLGAGNGYELCANIPLKPHLEENSAHSYVSGGRTNGETSGGATTRQNKNADQSVTTSAGNYDVQWGNPSDTLVEVPRTDVYDIEGEITVELVGTIFSADTIDLYIEDGGGGYTKVNTIAETIPNQSATYSFSFKNISVDFGESLVVRYVNSGGSELTIKASSFIILNGQSRNLTPYSTGGSSNYLIPSDVDYVSSGSRITMTDAEGTAKDDLNEINLIELQKVKFSDITKFNWPHTYELGDDNFSNECVSLLVNTNDISQGQFGQFPLYAFTKNRIFGFEFDSSADVLFRRIVTVFSEFGVQNRDTILPLNGQILFISPRGIHVLRGSQVEDIHRPIQQHWNYYNLVGTPTVPVSDSKIFYNHKLNEVYFYNDSFTEIFVFSFRYKMWYTFDHLSNIVQQIFDEEYPYFLTTTGLINMEDESTDKVNVLVRTKPYKITDKRDRKKLRRSFLRALFNKDDADQLQIKLQGVLGVNNFTNLSDWTLQNTGNTSYRDLVLRHKYAPMNYFRWVISGNLHPNSMLVTWDTEFEVRDSKLMHTWIGTGTTGDGGVGPGTGGVPEFPDPPTSLVATANGTSIDLTWTDNSTNETGFEIWRSTTSGSGYARVKTVAANLTSWTDDNNGSGLSSGTYYYIVRAVNTTTQSNFSNEANATIVISCFDISTSTYTTAFDASGQDSDMHDVIFNPDGSKMYLVGAAGDSVYEYDLSTNFDVDTVTFNQSFSLLPTVPLPYGIRFNNDGSKMFILQGLGIVYEYNLSTNYDISTSVLGNSFSVAVQESSPQGIHFKPDGTKLFVIGASGDDVNEYTLSSAWDITTLSYVQNFSVSAQSTSPSGITMSPDGTKMFITAYGGSFFEYDLSSAFDISTASYTQGANSISEGVTNPSGITFNPSGTKMFLTGISSNLVVEYSLSC